MNYYHEYLANFNRINDEFSNQVRQFKLQEERNLNREKSSWQQQE